MAKEHETYTACQVPSQLKFTFHAKKVKSCYLKPHISIAHDDSSIMAEMKFIMRITRSHRAQ